MGAVHFAGGCQDNRAWPRPVGEVLMTKRNHEQPGLASQPNSAKLCLCNGGRCGLTAFELLILELIVARNRRSSQRRLSVTSARGARRAPPRSKPKIHG
jgi:hypothetical protein